MAENLAIMERAGLGIAAVMARNGVSADQIAAALDLDLPLRPGVSHSGVDAAVGTGPGTWLVMREAAYEEFAESLADILRGLASVSDQSSGYVVLRLSGPGARTVLQRGAAIDLHPASFGPGSAATTVIAHIGVIFWRVGDSQAFDIALFRSQAQSFRHWLEDVARTL